MEFLLYKSRTWQIRTGLRSLTTSAIITNYWRSPGTSPVCQLEKHCVPSINILSDACYSILDIGWRVVWCSFSSKCHFYWQLTFFIASSNFYLAKALLFGVGVGGALIFSHKYISLSNIFSYALCGLVGNFLIFTSCTAQRKWLFNGLPCHSTTNHRCHRF